MKTNKTTAGFTLIEVMVTLAIISILAAIAVPSYTEYVKKSRRADAKAGLLNVQMAQEKYRANHISYGTLAQIGVPTTSPDGNYTLSVADQSASRYTATATRTGKQSGDKCGDYSINQAGTKAIANAYTGYDAAKCW